MKWNLVVNKACKIQMTKLKDSLLSVLIFNDIDIMDIT